MNSKACFLAAVLASSFAWAAKVSEVKIETTDGFGGDVSSIAAHCQTKAGVEFDRAVIQLDVKSLEETHSFEDVAASADEGEGGVVVTFRVRRKVRYVAPLTVTGAKYFGESKIASEAGLKDGILYGAGELAAAAERVRRAYAKKHFTATKVTPVVELLPGGDSASVRFDIVEGERQKIRDFVFNCDVVDSEGENSIDSGLLHKAISDYPWWNPVGWVSESPRTDDEIQAAVGDIAAVFRDAGYLDVAVSKPERVPVADESDCADVVFDIEAGPCYRVGDVSIAGLVRYRSEDIMTNKIVVASLPAKGSVAGAKALEAAAHAIEVAVGSGELGLYGSRVSVQTIPTEADDVIDLVFKVTEGSPVVIRDILIRGNDYTKDRVIRREIRLSPNNKWLQSEAERSQRRLENLDYFSRVRFTLEESEGKAPDGAEYRNLVYEVEDKNTGNFMIGVCASSVDSVYLSAEVQQPNFDLFAPQKWFRGAGQKARALVQWGPRLQTYEVGFSEPHLFDRALELDTEFYRRGRWYDDYDVYRTGGSVGISYPVKFWPTWSAFGRFGVRYTLEYVDFDDIEHGDWEYNGKTVSLDEEDRKYGGAWESIVRLYWGHDTRDSQRMPSTGSRSHVFFDVSAGGDNQYYRTGFNHRSYFTVWPRYRHVLMAAVRAETIEAISDDVPIYDRMFLGGPRSIRGVRYRNVSPFAKRDNDEMPWGGQTLFCMNFEYTVPVIKMFRIAAFTDLGSVGEDCFDLDFSDTFAWTAGVGLRLDIPMFPIRLDFAGPFKKPSDAEREVFSFTVNYDF